MADPDRVAAVVLAAGLGRRMNADKAGLDLGGVTALARIERTCAQAGVTRLVVVRRVGADQVELGANTRVATVGAGEMIDSLRAGVRALPGDADLLVFPVDHAMVGAEAVAAVIGGLAGAETKICLPLCEDRPGHPIALAAELRGELLDEDLPSLRDLIRRDPTRVAVVPVTDSWVCQDLDTPGDLAAARRELG